MEKKGQRDLVFAALSFFFSIFEFLQLDSDCII